ncbi:MAG: hypothetical protein EU532_03545 [Promethearchaeota archaeon]|nr:MAG: hypothetical protein EU532_03545 [Candidatus Lokiarchaeota archaeon]
MKYALMFNVLKDGEVEPIKWSREVFTSDRSIILLEEFTPAVWLWHGVEQSLVDRRIASRQAEALKGYGYKAKDTIIGSRTRIIKEIDQRKVGKDAETDQSNREFDELLNKKFNPIDEIIVAFQLGESEIQGLELKPKIVLEPTPKQESKPITIPTPKKISEKAQKSEVSAITLTTPQELKVKPATTKTKQISQPVKRQEFTFESQVKEVESFNTAEIIRDVLKRIEKMESKLDSLIEEFKELKANFIKE